MYQASSDLEYFKLLVAAPSDIPLFEAATCLGHIAYPDLKIEETQNLFDAMSQRLAVRCRNASTELARLHETSQYFYNELGFAGNVNNYYDADNSYLHKVIQSRRGIPITLALLFCELAKSVGLDANGISFPGHFLVRIDLHEGAVVMDPFTAQSLSREDLSERAMPYEEDLESLLQVASTRQILVRILANLRVVYEQEENSPALAAVNERLLILHGASL
jgi:regulator of sirC expression with transglutaminase-like and TPR domain